VLVGFSNFDFWQSRQNVQLGQVEGGESVNESRILHLWNIEPSTSTWSARGGSVLGTNLGQVHADTAIDHVEFSGEWTFTDTSAVGLDGTVNGSEFAGRHTETRQDGSDRWVGGGDEWVGTKVNIKHGSIGSFDKDLLSILETLISILDSIDGHAIDTVGNRLVVRLLSRNINFQTRMGAHLSIAEGFKTTLKGGPISKVTYSQTVARNLAGISWSDSLFGGTNLVTAQLVFLVAVNLLMKVKDKMSAIGKKDTALVFNTIASQGIEFVEETRNVNDNTVTDDARSVGVEDSGWKEMELVLFIANDDCVTSVGTTSDTSADVVFL
jgi:hypothetical protein